MAGAVLATLLVKIGTQVDDVKKGVDKVTRDLDGVKAAADRIDKSVATSFANVAKSAAAMAAGLVTAEVAMAAVSAVADTVVSAVKGVANAFVSTVQQTVQLGDTLFSLSQKTGISVEALSALRFAATQTNTDLETITGAVFKMQTTLGKGGEATAKAVAQLGLSLRELRSADPADAFTRILKALGELPNATQRAATGAQIFGRAFKDIAQLTQGDLGALMKQARDLGAVMSTETAVAADRFGDALAAMQARAEGLALAIGSSVLPALIAFVETIGTSFSRVLEQSGVSVGGLQTIIDELVVSVGQAAARLIEIVANMVDAVTVFVTGEFIKSLAILDIFQEIAARAIFAGQAIDLAFNFGRLQPAFDALSTRLKTFRDFTIAAGEGALLAGANIRRLAEATRNVAQDVGASFRQTFERVKAEIVKAANEMRSKLGTVGDLGEAAVSDITKAFERLQDKIRGVDLVKTAKAWELALQDPKNVAFTFADRTLSTELRDALDAVVVKFGDLETAGVGAMKAIHDSVRQRLLPAVREGLEGIRKLPGEFLSIFDALRPGLAKLDPKSLPGATGILPRGLADVVTHPFRDAFLSIGQELPQLIFGAIQSQQSVIATIAGASAERFMKVFNDAIIRINKTPGGGTLKAGEKLAGIVGVSLASLAGGIALGGQTTSLTKGALAGAGAGALGGLPLAAATGGLSVVAGAAVGLFGGLLGASGAKKQEQQALQATKAQFEAQFGGIRKLQELAQKAGLDIQRVFDARNARQFNDAVRAVNEQLAAYNKHLEGLQTALNGVNQRSQVFAANFETLIQKRDDLTNAGTGGSELESINAKIAETAQRVQPEFERLGLMVRDTFAAIVRETGDAFGAIAQLAPAFQVLQDGVNKFGLESTAAIDELLKNFSLINDETFGPFLQNIQASGQVLRGLFDAKALSPEGFQAIAADIGQSFQEIANRGGDITRALALNQPVLQALFEAQQRYGTITDQTTLSILRQAEEQGLVGEHMKDVNEQILDVLIAIADVFGAKIPDALRKTEQAAQDTATGIEDALSDIKVPKIKVPIDVEMPEGVPWFPERTPEITPFATGGIVRRPTLALIGEAGPEAVVPLDRLASAQQIEGSARAGTITVNIYGDVDSEERAERMVREFARQVRLGGTSRTVVLDSLGIR